MGIVLSLYTYGVGLQYHLIEYAYLLVGVSIIWLSTITIYLPKNYSECPDIRLVGEAAIFDTFG